MEPVQLVMTPAAIAGRGERRLRKRREEYERDRARGRAVLPPPRRPRSFLEW